MSTGRHTTTTGYITKWSLKKGIVGPAEVSISHTSSRLVILGEPGTMQAIYLYKGKDFFESLDDAIKDSVRRLAKRRRSLTEELRKLEDWAPKVVPRTKEGL